MVSFVSSEESEDVLPILSLAYHADGSVEFARGSLLKPTFETVPAETVADLLAAGTSKLVRPGESVRSLLVAETAGPATKKRKDENEVIVLRGSESGEPGVGAVVFEEEDLELPTHMPKSSELPLSQRLASINLATPQPAPKPAKVPATTLLSLLTQALRTSDPTLLESCLTTTHLATIKQTVAKLGTPWILPLLGALESRIRAKPVRTRQLLPWLKTLLVTHTGYLTSHPSIPPRLAALESLLRARLGAVEKMYGLLGRLEVALSSVERRGLEEDGEEGMAVYREEEEEWEGGVGEGEEEEEEGFLEVRFVEVAVWELVLTFSIFFWNRAIQAAESDSEAGNESDSESGEEISDDEDGDEDEDEELEGFSDEDGSDDDDEEEED